MSNAQTLGQIASDMIQQRTGIYVNPALLKAQLQVETGNFAKIDDALKAVHNYGGMSTDEDTGLPRPPEEGGYYKRYASDEEFVEDWGTTLSNRAAYWKKIGGGDVNDVSTFNDMLLAEDGWHYYTGDPDDYKRNLEGFLSVDAPDLIDGAVQHVGAWGTTKPYLLPGTPDVQKQYSFWEEFYNKFMDAELDNGVISAARNAWANFSNSDSLAEWATSTYKPSQEDIELVQKGLAGDTIAQQYVLTQAHNRQTLLALLAVKQEDRARREAVDSMDYGLSTIGTVLGSVLDPTILLSMIASPIGSVAAIASKAAKVRTLISLGGKVLDSNKAARMAAGALTSAVSMGADRFAAERWGGWHPDYATSMAGAALLGAIGGALRKAKLPEDVAKKLEDTSNRIEEDTIANSIGVVPPNSAAREKLQRELTEEMLGDYAQEGSDIDLKWAEKEAKRLAEEAELNRQPEIAQEGTDINLDATNTVEMLGGQKKPIYPKATKGAGDITANPIDTQKVGVEIEAKFDQPVRPEENVRNPYSDIYAYFPNTPLPIKKLIENKSLFILSEEKAKSWAKKYGVFIKEDAKAFSLPKFGVSIIIKEKVDKSNILGVVAHEIGVHVALKRIIGDTKYNQLLDLARERMKNPQDPKWINATRKATNAEEALAYYIEQIDWTTPPRRLHFIKKALTKYLQPQKATDMEIAKAVKYAIGKYAHDEEKILSFLKVVSRSKKSTKWKRAAEATKGKDMLTTLHYWLKHDPDRGLLWNELKKLVKADLNKNSVTRDEILAWAKKNIFKESLSFPIYKVVKAYDLKAGSPLMKIEAFGDTPHLITQTNLATYKAIEGNFNLGNDVKPMDLVADTLKRNAQETIKKAEPVQELPDGTKVVDNVVYTPNNVCGEGLAAAAEDTGVKATTEENLLGEIHYSKGDVKETVFDLVSDKGETSQARQGKFGKLGLWVEHGTFFGNLYGIMINSHSRGLQTLAKTLFNDPRMEATNVDHLPAESIKSFLQNRWNSLYIGFVDSRMDYVNKHFGIFDKVHRNNCILKVNEQVIQCYNAKARGDTVALKAFDDDIKKMAVQLEELVDDTFKQMKTNSEKLGGQVGLGSLLKHDEPMSACKEFYRITDIDKYREWFTRNFSSAEDAEKFLAEYARRFMDREAEIDYFKKEHRYKYDQRKVKDKKKYVEPTEEEIEKHLEDAALGWAKGRIDMNMSRLEYGQSLHKAHVAETLKHRLPMDTSGIMKMPNGVSFSFDAALRNYDIDEYLPQLLNRLSGETALRATLGTEDKQKALFDRITRELAKADLVRNGDRESEAMMMGLRKILGVGSYNLMDQKVSDAFSNMIRSWSYANVGGNMTWAQLGEVGGSIAYGGWKVLFNNIPWFKDFFRAARVGGDTAKVIEDVTTKLYAEDIATRGWSVTNTTESKIFRQLFDKVSEENPKASLTGRALDTINATAKKAALLTSTVNFMPKLTNLMVRSMRQAAIEDSLQWAKGKEFTGFFATRNPFSKKKFAAIGITDQKAISEMRADIKKYLVDGRGNIDTWREENPTTFFKWQQMMDNEALRGIQQNTIGNMNPFKEKHRLFFQFKDFTLKAMNQQFMRALSSRERDDALAALYSYATNSAAYAGLTYMKALAYFPDDPEKRKEYLDKEMSLQKVALSGFFRMSLTAPMSFAADGWEVATGQSMFRTTVDNSRYQRDASDSWNQRVGDIMNQAPALGTMGRAYNAAKSVSNLATGEGTQKDIDNCIKFMPLGMWLGMTYMGSMAKKNTGVPEKKQAQQTQSKTSKLLSANKGNSSSSSKKGINSLLSTNNNNNKKTGSKKGINSLLGGKDDRK